MNCTLKERSISYALGVELPTKDETDKDKVFDECCYSHVVLADLENKDNERNDYSSFFHQKQVNGESVKFVLIDLKTNTEYNLDNNDFGEFFDFGDFDENINFSGFQLHWKKVIEELGTGTYKIAKNIKRLGIEVNEISFGYTLRKYTTANADKTIRMDIVLNGAMQKSKVDFSGLNWKDSIRLPGFFGRREFQFEEDVLVSKKFENKQISMHQTNEYKMQTNKIPNCVIEPVIDLFLYADYIYLNDYNLNNHSYKYKNFLVRYKSNESTDFYVKSRHARLNLVFSDKFENNLKRNYK